MLNLKDLLDFVNDPSEFEVLYSDAPHRDPKPITYLNKASDVSDTSQFYLAGFEFGATRLIHVESYEGYQIAWESFKDSLPKVEGVDLLEAYAPNEDSEAFYWLARDVLTDSEPKIWYGVEYEVWREKVVGLAQRMLNEQVQRVKDGEGDYPHLIEGYEECDNGEVVDVGHYAWMRQVTNEDIVVFTRKACTKHEDCAENPELGKACSRA